MEDQVANNEGATEQHQESIDVSGISKEPDAPVEANGKTRERSTVKFAYLDLDASCEVPLAIHEHYGLRCTTDQLAAKLGHKDVRSGAFLRKIYGAQAYDLIVKTEDGYALSETGRFVVREDTRATGKAKAFLFVELYKMLFDEFKGGTLPSDAGLEATIRRFGVPEKQADGARQVFRRSAEQAGFFEHGKDRLVAPAALTKAIGPMDALKDSGERAVDEMSELSKRLEELERENRQLRSNTSKMLTVPDNLPAAIAGLLHALPLGENEQWSEKDLADWTASMKTTVKLTLKDRITIDGKPRKVSSSALQKPSEQSPTAVQP